MLSKTRATKSLNDDPVYVVGKINISLSGSLMENHSNSSLIALYIVAVFETNSALPHPIQQTPQNGF